MSEVELLPVEQVDRDAAADLLALDLGEPLSPADLFQLSQIRLGFCDDDDGVQAFAAHRLSTRPLPADGVVVPEGFKLVPVAATEEMLLAGAAISLGGKVHGMDAAWMRRMQGIWSAMLSASPVQGEHWESVSDEAL